MKNWILDRLSEKTTWLGLITMLGAVGVSVSPELSGAVMAAGLALVGLVNVLLNEK